MVGSLFAGRNNIKVGDSVDIKYNNISKSYKVKVTGGDEDLNVFSTLSSSQQLLGVEGKFQTLKFRH